MRCNVLYLVSSSMAALPDSELFPTVRAAFHDLGSDVMKKGQIGEEGYENHAIGFSTDCFLGVLS